MESETNSLNNNQPLTTKQAEKENAIMTEFGLNPTTFKALKKKIKGLAVRDDRAFMGMLRSVNKNHYTLNQMVDRKARILLSVNALILSLIIGKIITNHEMNDWKFSLLVFFGITCILSIIYAMMAVSPEKSHGKLNEESITNKEGNLLFFGNFKNMSETIYENKIMEMVEDREFIYRSMIRDIYYLGQVLEKKRQYLRRSLFIFIFGLCASLLLAYTLRFLLMS